MSKTIVTLQLQSASILQDDSVIVLGETVLKKCKIPKNQSLFLRFGSSKNNVKVISVPQSDALRMSYGLMSKFGLHQGVRLRIHYKAGSSTIFIGPLIAVMVSRVYPDSADKPFGKLTAFCKELDDACRLQGAFVYFFTPNDIESNRPNLNGWTYSGYWRKHALPLPDVVHNRLTSRKLENKPSVQHLIKEVKSAHGASVFNEKFLDKTEVFQALKNEPAVTGYLPESYALRNYAMLKSMCSKHPIIFLKPVRGSLGKGIIRISRQGSGAYSCHFTNVNGARSQNYSSIAKVFSAISSKMKVTRYQIQQGLNLIRVSGRPVDFRALVQKTTGGQWAITSIVARIAGSNHFVSNLAKGGTLSRVKEALQKSNLSADTASGVSARLRKASIDIAKGIESSIPYHFGELGVDLAVDVNGKVWLLEVNSKPSKNDDTPLTDKKIRPSVVQLVKYARYISGF
jgi:glutathione synthase/RimK-type ligase-like ATP-grasp enzyme